MLQALDATALRRWCATGCEVLGAARAEIDGLNVFPVADGDTGTNLLLTLEAAQAAVEGAEGLPGTAAALTTGALTGARGSSGVLLSQLLRGLAEALAGGPAGPVEVAAGLVRGAELAYAAVEAPLEGTLLTVARAAGHAAQVAAEAGGALPAVVGAACGAAEQALARTTGQLLVLARSGVVDAGGRGWALLLGALADVVAGRDAVPRPLPAPRPAAPAGPSGAGGFEVQYLLRDADDAGGLRQELAGLGDSLVVVGEPGLFHVHVHVERRGQVDEVVRAGERAGRPAEVRVTPLGPGAAVPTEGAAPGRRLAVLAVVAGEGLAATFAAAGAAVLSSASGAPTARQLRDRATALAAERGLPADRPVIVLTGDLAGRRAAEEAAALPGQRRLAVLAGRSPVQGLAALAVADPERAPDDDLAAMAQASSATRTAEVVLAVATAQTSAGLCLPGDALGVVDGRVALVALDPAAVARAAGGPAGGGRGAAHGGARTGRPRRARAGAARARRRRAPGGAAVSAARRPAGRAAAGRGVAAVDPSTPLARALGDRTAKVLGSGLDLHTVGDLLHHYPRRYVERGQLTSFRDLVVGEHATVLAEVVTVAAKQLREKLRKADVTVVDGEGQRLTMTMFNNRRGERELLPRRRAFFSGQGRALQRQGAAGQPGVAAARRRGRRRRGGRRRVRRRPGAALPGGGEDLDVHGGPQRGQRAARRRPRRRPAAGGAARRPSGCPGCSRRCGASTGRDGWPQVAASRRRLVWDEAFGLQVVLAQRRAALRASPTAPRVPRPDGLLAAFDRSLPFTLTGGQREVGDLVLRELAGPRPDEPAAAGRGRLGQDAGRPARDARRRGRRRPGRAAGPDRGARPAARPLAARACSGRSRRAASSAPPSTRPGWRCSPARWAPPRGAPRWPRWPAAPPGSSVGTHALLSEGVRFADLGLVVVDEQHRFGVEQRDALRAKGASPHLLVMTATPIPRTVAMTVYGDLEVSTLRELPAGRSPIRSSVVPLDARPQLAGDRSGSGSARRSRRAGRPSSSARGSAATTRGRWRRPARRGRRRGRGGRRRGRRGRRARPGRRRAGRPAGRGAARPAGRRTSRTTSCGASRPARSTCWSRPRWSRSASTCPTRP